MPAAVTPPGPLRIRDLFADGRAVAAPPDGPVMILPPGPVPGDLLRADADGRLVLLDASPDRVTPRCPLFGTCPGCALQALSAPAQARWKTGLVDGALRRVGRLAEPPLDPCAPSPASFGWRNKAVLTFGGAPVQLGYRRGGHGGGEVLPVEHCHLLPPWMSAAARETADAVRASGLPAWDMVSGRGWARKLLLREGARTGQRLLALLHSPDGNPRAVASLGAELRRRFPDSVFTGLLAETSRPRDTDQGERLTPLWGPGHIEEHLAGIRFRVSPNSFFQVNTAAAEHLLMRVRDWAAAIQPRRVFDLYCGAGLFALALAAPGRIVSGLDASADAIADAKVNAGLNDARVEFTVRDLAKPGAFPELGPGDLVVVDPPRSGLPGWMTSRLADARADALVYVSCDPASLARDLRGLLAGGWRLESARPFDLFPQTGHVETLALLRRPG